MLLSTFCTPFIRGCLSLKEAIENGKFQELKCDIRNILMDLMGCFQNIEQYFILDSRFIPIMKERAFTAILLKTCKGMGFMIFASIT